jgi:hypothetical protein
MGSGKKSNGRRRVSKADGTKKRAKKAMRKSRRVDSLQMLREELQRSPDFPSTSEKMQQGFNPLPELSSPRPYDWRDVLRAYGRAIYQWFCV